MQISDGSYKLAVEGAECGVWEFDFNKKALSCSQMLRVMLGYPPYKALDRIEDWEDLITAEDLPVFRQALKSHVEEFEPLKVDIRMVTKNKGEKLVRFLGTSKLGPAAETERICALVVDLSEL